MISVVIPLYNKESSIAHTLSTVFAQTVQNYEIVVVDDGSTDGSAEVVRAIADRRVRLVTQPNGGVSAARNRGIEEARGELVAFLDADDEWKPDYLATQMMLVEHYPECNVFATSFETRNADGLATPAIIRYLPFEGNCGELTNYFRVASSSHPPLFTSAVMVRRTAILAVGGFPVGVKSGEDLLTWARLAVRNRIAYCRQPKAVFVFDESLFTEDQKKRAPEQEDIVGRELSRLFMENRGLEGLDCYLALWHKMRARIFIMKHQRFRAIKECLKSMRYHVSVKIVVFMLMTCLPYKCSAYLFKRLG